METLATLHDAVREPLLLQRLLAGARAVEGGYVAIGTETGYPGLEQSAVVGYPFGAEGWKATVAVLGPMRMDYAQVFQLTAGAAAELDALLERLWR